MSLELLGIGGVHKYHERILREFSKRKDDDHNKRMEALKNNDVERYREMLLEQQTNIPGEAAERYAVLSSFLTQTEEYLYKLGSKITAAKNQQEVEEAANAAAVAAQAQVLFFPYNIRQSTNAFEWLLKIKKYDLTVEELIILYIDF